MKLRGTATNNLSDVIQMLQIARKTGILTLQRAGKGDFTEQGTMTFAYGRIIDASLENIKGSRAFDQLMAWRDCYFIFHPSLSSDITPALPSGPLPPISQTSPLTSNGSSPNHVWSSVNNNTQKQVKPAVPLVHSAPYRLREAQDVLAYFERVGLSRAHRQLFLLINGRYTHQELMRLSGHQDADFELLLSDLERFGLIHR